jgi:hypothetical protein
MPRALTIAVFVIGIGMYTAFTWWTVQRLWQPASNPYRRIVYKFGVRLGGVTLWILMSVAGALAANTPRISPWGDALIALGLNLPLCLWIGYAYGRFMALVYGLSDSP